jgi:peroxidase
MAYSIDPAVDLPARAPDGSGNNPGGAAHSDYRRVTPNSYADDKGAMPLPEAPTSVAQPPFTGLDQYDGPLPQPREITERVMAQPKDAAGNDLDIPNRFGVSEYFQFFGQFLTHDVAEAPLGPFVPGVTAVPDALWLDGLPFAFVRTPGHEVGGVRQQENEETSFLDLSMVYGKSAAMLGLLRAGAEGGAQSAKLLMGADDLLPSFNQVAADSGQSITQVQSVLVGGGPGFNAEQFAAGDNRANQNAGLLTHQTVWARNHNWHVDQLAAKHPDWSQEQLFNAARALNEAEFQHVVFDEYLAKLLGPGALGGYSGHKAGVDASAINEWATTAFRFGHDQSRNTVDRMNEAGASVETVTLATSFARANAAAAFDDPGGNPSASVMEEWIRGQLAQATQEIDGRVVDGNRNALFGIPGATVDLEVLDIQRGRDHGVADLNNLREGLGLKPYSNIDSFVGQNNAGNAIGREAREALRDIYDGDIGKMDAVVAGLLEKNEKGSTLGETFHKLTVMQFQALRDGDGFYYEARLPGQLAAEVKAVSLAEIIARNTGMDVYRDAFLTHARKGGSDGNETISGDGGRDLLLGFGGDDGLGGAAGADDHYGGAGADTMDGGDGDDLLNGGAGNDVGTGGKGRDIFVFEGACGQDTVTDFKDREDLLDLSDYGFASIEAVRARTVATDRTTLVIDVGPDGGDAITVRGLTLANLDASDVILVG